MTLDDLIKVSTKRVEVENHTCYWAADGYKFDNQIWLYGMKVPQTVLLPM